MIHEIPGRPSTLELAKLVATRILAQLAEDTEAESEHRSSYGPSSPETWKIKICIVP